MHPMHRTPSALLLALAASASAGDCAAALVVTADNKASGDQAAFAAQVLADDLVNVGRPTLASVTVSNYDPYLVYGIFASSVDGPDYALNNGILGQPTTFGPTMPDGIGAFSLTDSWSVTFGLNIDLSPGGYDLTAIRAHTAHFDNRTSQKFAVLVEYAADPGAWVLLGAFESEGPTGTNNQAHQLVLGDAVSPGVAPFAVGVSAVRFDIETFDHRAVWREFDVVGTAAAVPEPASAAWLAGALALGAATLRRRPRSVLP